MLSSEQLPTRSAILQLREEQGVISEAYDFLDEKRLMLAAELLRQLQRYEDLLVDYEALRLQAQQALAATVRRHGLQGTQVYPAHYLEECQIQTTGRNFMGVSLYTTERVVENESTPLQVSHPSPEAEHCRTLFLELIDKATVMAGVSGNLYRLMAEYRRTERRARALENVVLPELEQLLRDMSNQLEELDQEDIIRMHLKHG
jgi:V/A-type H+-transporting ATPase subunit D